MHERWMQLPSGQIQQMGFWCDESLGSKDEDKIDLILDHAFRLADEVEFNILYRGESDLASLIYAVKSDVVIRGRRFDKIYNGVEFIRFRLSDSVKRFVRSRGLFGWRNSQLEDISFLRGGFEFLGTVSHENYLILQMTDDERKAWNETGFNFEYYYGLDPREVLD